MGEELLRKLLRLEDRLRESIDDALSTPPYQVEGDLLLEIADFARQCRKAAEHEAKFGDLETARMLACLAEEWWTHYIDYYWIITDVESVPDGLIEAMDNLTNEYYELSNRIEQLAHGK